MPTAEAAKPTSAPDNGLGFAEFLAGPPKVETPAAAPVEPVAVVEPKSDAVAEAKPADLKAEVPKAEPDPRDKRIKDKDRHINTLERENRDLRTQMTSIAGSVKRVEEKLDGTYVESKADPVKDEQERLSREWQIKVRASVEALADTFPGGREAIQATIFAEDAPFRKYDDDVLVRARLHQADNPVKEALTVLKEAEFREKYGNDPEAMKAKLTAELTPQITEIVTKELMAQLKANGSPMVNGLGGVRAAATGSAAETQKGPPSAVNLNAIFPGFAESRI